jgi:hypothetical protein
VPERRSYGADSASRVFPGTRAGAGPQVPPVRPYDLAGRVARERARDAEVEARIAAARARVVAEWECGRCGSREPALVCGVLVCGQCWVVPR